MNQSIFIFGLIVDEFNFLSYDFAQKVKGAKKDAALMRGVLRVLFYSSRFFVSSFLLYALGEQPVFC